LNPKWVTSFKLPYQFEKVQPLMFKVYDIDDKNAGLDKQDFIGHAVQLSSTRARARSRHCSPLVSAITGVPAQRTDDVERPDARVDPCVRDHAYDHRRQ
jgi:hypothetical protein